jgi:hypothetical protein
MDDFVRPVSRLTAVELPDSDLDVVSGGCCPSTDYYAQVPCSPERPEEVCWVYQGSSPNDC